MKLALIDQILWAAGFSGGLLLLFTLLWRGRYRQFPFFTAFISLGVLRDIVLYFIHYGSASYSWSFLGFDLCDSLLQLAIVYEISAIVFRPVGVWARDIRGPFLRMVVGAPLVATALTATMPQISKNPVYTLIATLNLFNHVLMTELVAIVLFCSSRVGLVWRNHVLQIADGFGVYSVLTFVVVLFRTYHKVGHGIDSLSRTAAVVWLAILIYWIVNLWKNEPPRREITPEMKAQLFALRRTVAYDLGELKSRNQ